MNTEVLFPHFDCSGTWPRRGHGKPIFYKYSERCLSSDLWVLCHDDGACADGSRYTPLVDGICPVCKFAVDMQSTCLSLRENHEEQPVRPIHKMKFADLNISVEEHYDFVKNNLIGFDLWMTGRDPEHPIFFSTEEARALIKFLERGIEKR